jgi:Ca-activated chloride channel family protein
VLLALAALLEPAWGESGALEARGSDVVVCLDVSRSMLATDEEPTRLERAREEIRALAAAARGDRLALVAFAGEARLVVPLTRDGEALAALADAADPLSVARGGSDLGAALDAALAALDAGSGDAAAIVLLTDGEDHGGGGLSAAERCRARGVPVHAVGLGSARGSKIPVPGPRGPEFLRDPAGAEVVSGLDADSLRRIADASGGSFLEAGAGAPVLPELHARRLVPDARRAFSVSARSARTPRFQWFLLGALVLWILGPCRIEPARS